MKKCTPKQLNFVIEYCRNGMDVVTAYKSAFTSKNDDVAYTEGNRLLTLPWIENEIKKHKTTLDRRAIRLGLDDESLLKQHKKLVYATKKIYNKEGEFIDELDDFQTIAKGLEMVYKLLGKNAAERKSFEGINGKALFPETDFSKLSADELRTKRESLLTMLKTEYEP